jgi:hypothetical protein
MIQDLLFEKQYTKLALMCPRKNSRHDHGENPHPAIAQLFTDPQTGIFNRQAFLSFMQRIQAKMKHPMKKVLFVY